MNKPHFTIALLITLVLTVTITVWGFTNSVSAHEVKQLSNQLQSAQAQLDDARLQLADAHAKMSFIERNKAHVQVTAYALTEDFGPDPLFSNNTPARTAYAVPKHTLPTGKVLNVALSPLAERKLHAHLNDTLVLQTRKHQQYVARFVDRTAQSETRPVVDILFADAHQARIWGRQNLYAVNISSVDSPFGQQ
jgi:type II secretory pathway pseudopilin PulG